MSYQVGAAKITKIPEIVLQSFIPEALFLISIRMCGQTFRNG
jgi:hypothetical protein